MRGRSVAGSDPGGCQLSDDPVDDPVGEPVPLGFVGEGPFPPEFDRVNWGAYGCSPFWLLMYGPRAWLFAFLGAVGAEILIDNIALLFFDSATVFPAVQKLTSVANAVVLPLLVVGYAITVNRLVWQREHARFAAAGDIPAHPIPLVRYRKSTRFWTRLFIAFFVVGYAGSIGLYFTHRIQLSALNPGVGTVVLISVFIYDRVLARRNAKLTNASGGRRELESTDRV